MIIEFLGGFFSNSVAIMTDAAHMLSDVSAFLISILSIYFGRKKSNNIDTYGYHRSEVLGALASILIIWGLVIWLIFEATERIDSIVHHEGFEIDAYIMLYTSILSLVCNIINLVALGHCGNSSGSVLDTV
jgi:zinc transporter 2